MRGIAPLSPLHGEGGRAATGWGGFVKAQRARALDAHIGRGAKSIEFKHMNISAVLTELGMPIIRGYRPMTNYQRAIFPALERYLDAHPAAWNLGLPLSSPFHGEGDHEVVEWATRRRPLTRRFIIDGVVAPSVSSAGAAEPPPHGMGRKAGR